MLEFEKKLILITSRLRGSIQSKDILRSALERSKIL